MGTVSPPADFYIGADGSSTPLSVTGVRAPIKVSSSNLILINELGQQMVSISTDTALTEDSDQYLVTQKVVKASGASSIYATVPIYNTFGTLDLKNSLGETMTAISTDYVIPTPLSTVIPTQDALVDHVSEQIKDSGLPERVVNNAVGDAVEVYAEDNLITSTSDGLLSVNGVVELNSIADATLRLNSGGATTELSSNVLGNATLSVEGDSFTSEGDVIIANPAPSLTYFETPGGSLRVTQWNASTAICSIDSTEIWTEDQTLKIQKTPEVILSTTSPQLKIASDATNRFDISTSATGIVTLNPTGGVINMTSDLSIGGDVAVNGTAEVSSSDTSTSITLENTNGLGIPNNTVDTVLAAAGKVSTVFEGTTTTKEETKSYSQFNVPIRATSIILVNGALESTLSLGAGGDVRLSPPRWAAMPGFAALRDNSTSSAIYNQIGTSIFYGWGYGNSTNYLNGSAVMPADVADSTMVIPIIHWMTDAASTLKVLWRLNLAYQLPGTVGTILTSAQQDVNPSLAGSAYQMNTTTFPGLSTTSYPQGTSFFWRIGRIGGDPLDTYAGNVWLTAFFLAYQADRVIGITP